jgi:hypothetical protein
MSPDNEEAFKEYGRTLGKIYVGMCQGGMEPSQAGVVISIVVHMAFQQKKAGENELDAMLKKIIKQAEGGQ